MNLDIIKTEIEQLSQLPVKDRVQKINAIKLMLKEHSPFSKEPVDCVLWIPKEEVTANDYNPNSVAPPEMRLLKCSIEEDGYTQPIVAWRNDDKTKYEIIDGFHRHRVGKEYKDISERVHGYLPLAVVNTEKTGKAERIASTIRHNRARGKHSVSAMSEIVLELKNRNWKNDRIARELGMDEEEILRLTQISGLETMFANEDFSKAWLADDAPDDFRPVDDETVEDPEFRTVNTSDKDRIFHTFDKWECHKAGFYDSSVPGITKSEGERRYAEFLSDDNKFRVALAGVITKWKHSCEHYLTNKAMNRIAWLGQASACYSEKLPSSYCSGFNRMTDEQKSRANNTALKYLNKWLRDNKRPEVTLEQGLGGEDRQVSIY